MAFGRYDDDFEDPYPTPSGPPPMTGTPQTPINITKTPPAAADAADPGGGIPGGGGYGGGWSALSYNFPGAPEFKPTMFAAPSFADAMKEPGYEFRLKGGTQALDRSAAAQGTLRTGGNLKNILEYGQNFAAQEYSNVFNRALQAHGANYTAQRDMFAPRLAEYNNKFRAEQARALAEFQAQFANRGGGGNPYAGLYADLDVLGPEPGPWGGGTANY